MTVCLAMMVRDEAERIERAIDSVRGLIDTWVILDTGSVDDTSDLITAALHDVPGRLIESDWVDFGTCRSRLVSEARGAADWLLLLDADMTAQGTIPDVLAGSEPTAWMLKYEGPLDYRQPLLVSGRHSWRYEGATHEYLTSSEPYVTQPLDSLTITHHADGSHRAEKFTRDLALLAGKTDARSTFYRAQTLRDLGLDEAARVDYERRAAMGGFEEEAWYAAWQTATLTLTLDGLDQATHLLLDAWERRPRRAEPLYVLAQAERLAGRPQRALAHAKAAVAIPYPTEDVLFIWRDVYEWGALFELSIAAGQCGQADACAVLSADLRNRALPVGVREAVERNISWAASVGQSTD